MSNQRSPDDSKNPSSEACTWPPSGAADVFCIMNLTDPTLGIHKETTAPSGDRNWRNLGWIHGSGQNRPMCENKKARLSSLLSLSCWKPRSSSSLVTMLLQAYRPHTFNHPKSPCIHFYNSYLSHLSHSTRPSVLCAQAVPGLFSSRFPRQ